MAILPDYYSRQLLQSFSIYTDTLRFRLLLTKVRSLSHKLHKKCVLASIKSSKCCLKKSFLVIKSNGFSHRSITVYEVDSRFYLLRRFELNNMQHRLTTASTWHRSVNIRSFFNCQIKSHSLRYFSVGIYKTGSYISIYLVSVMALDILSWYTFLSNNYNWPLCVIYVHSYVQEGTLVCLRSTASSVDGTDQ